MDEATDAALMKAGATIERLQRELAPCSRSHPHENMGRMCELRVRVAKAENERFHAIERAEKAERERDEARAELAVARHEMLCAFRDFHGKRVLFSNSYLRAMEDRAVRGGEG